MEMHIAGGGEIGHFFCNDAVGGRLKSKFLCNFRVPAAMSMAIGVIVTTVQVQPSGITLGADDRLVEAARRGSRRAFGTLVEKYQTSVFGIAYGLTCSATESEELTQEVFLAA